MSSSSRLLRRAAPRPGRGHRSAASLAVLQGELESLDDEELLGAAAYLGESLLAAGGDRWAWDDAARQPAWSAAYGPDADWDFSIASLDALEEALRRSTSSSTERTATSATARPGISARSCGEGSAVTGTKAPGTPICDRSDRSAMVSSP
ncbi:hypothetical protein [Virgisporangium ochraceum]|uniref:hypothetical protein n=1 Tax=Virgisporangium ochraceum TaxID=65505 RepID=UPI0019444116|nr:hypothetical protein [Virgisporangium ochraceum]